MLGQLLVIKAFRDRGICRFDGSLRSALFFAGKYPGRETLSDTGRGNRL
jgi:hypothetical protein